MPQEVDGEMAPATQERQDILDGLFDKAFFNKVV